MKKYFVSLILFLLFAQVYALKIAGNYTIVIPDNANPIELKAAQHFAIYMQSYRFFSSNCKREKI